MKHDGRRRRSPSVTSRPHFPPPGTSCRCDFMAATISGQTSSAKSPRTTDPAARLVASSVLPLHDDICLRAFPGTSVSKGGSGQHRLHQRSDVLAKTLFRC